MELHPPWLPKGASVPHQNDVAMLSSCHRTTCAAILTSFMYTGGWSLSRMPQTRRSRVVFLFLLHQSVLTMPGRLYQRYLDDMNSKQNQAMTLTSPSAAPARFLRPS